MSATTASVEVLTAEVRTLVVGSRQVTLSVYRQLDAVPLARIEPFGRVRAGDTNVFNMRLVGRDRQTGALVACHLFFLSSDHRNVDRDVWERMKQLPLIVLAGLR